MRHLLVTRRQIPLDRLDEYGDAWDELCRAAVQRGARAWRFRAASREDHYLEFVEWGGAAARGLLRDAGFAAARATVDESFVAMYAEEWIES